MPRFKTNDLFFNLCLGSICLVFLAWGLNFSYSVITQPHQAEVREASALATTAAIAAGENPFGLEHAHQNLNTYGFVYGYVTGSLSFVFGNTLEMHRAVTGTFNILACVLLFFLMNSRAPIVLRLALCLVLFSEEFTFYLPLARPDGLGLSLFLLALFVTGDENSSWKRLSLGVGIALLALFTKPYFLACVGAIGLLLLLRARFQKFAIYFCATTTAVVGALALANFIFPAYLNDTLFFNLNIATDSVEWRHAQNVEYLTQLWPLLIAALLGLVFQGRKKLEVWRDSHFVLGLAGAALGVVLLFKMGKHNGTLLVYYIHMLSPFLLILMSYALAIGEIRLSLKWVANVAIIFAFGVYFYSMPPRFGLPTGEDQRWSLVGDLADKADHILNSPAIAGLLLEKHKEVWDSGYSEYLSVANERVSGLAAHFPRAVALEEADAAFKKDVAAKVAAQYFDVIMLSAGENWMIDNESLARSYTFTSSVVLPMDFTHQKWTLGIWLRKR